MSKNDPPQRSLTPIVTGANRGLGFHLVRVLSSRPDTVVFAGTRSIDKDDDLLKLARKLPDVIFPIHMTSASEDDNKAAAQIIKDQTGKVDIVIANAGRPNLMA